MLDEGIGGDDERVARRPRDGACGRTRRTTRRLLRWTALAASAARLALALAGAGGWAAPASAAPPAPLSAETRAVDVASTFGSGGFGTWVVDRFGLPAFRYEIDQRSDPRARQPELAGATRAQHQVGNDQIVAAAFNEGWVQFWSQARLSQWANRWEPEARHYAGGFGYLVVDGAVSSTLHLDAPAGVEFERVFGVGSYRKALRIGDVEVEQVVYAPFGDDPVLLDDVTITNHGAESRDVSWFEYWDVNPFDQTGMVSRGVGRPVWDATTSTLSATQSGGALEDDRPLVVFAAALRGTVDGFETSVDAFFGAGTRAAPAAVVADRLAGTIAAPSAPGAPGGALFAFRSPATLSPGESVTLRYAYGMAHADRVAGLVATHRAAADPLSESARAWSGWLPRADFGPSRTWVARELQWAAYSLRSAAVFEEVCGHHTITQGGYYQYQGGLNLGSRSWLHYLLPIVYTEPELAREILRYSISLQTEVGNEIPYGSGPLCTRYRELGDSNDLDFWLLLAAAEYGLATRDTGFFGESLPFHDTKARVSAWEHVKLAYRHQETYRGERGYLTGSNGDWSDFSTVFLQLTESTLVAVQLAYAYPRLADLADRLGDGAFAAEVRHRAAEIAAVAREEWTGKGWYSRGWAVDRQVGAGAIFGEPQPWAILAGLPTPAQAATLVGNIRRFLGGVGAPAVVNGPSRIGSSIVPASNDPEVTERSFSPDGVGDNNSNYVGGTWFDVNGWLTWALAELDGVVPGARDYAWSEYTRNTLANHATQFPDHWAGTISIDDACFPYFSSAPEKCGIPLFDEYGGQITEQPTWMVMDAIRLAGITPTGAGYRIAPRFPFATFSLRLPRVGIAVGDREMRGYLRVEESGPIEMRVAVPDGIPAGAVEAFADGERTDHGRDGGFVVFTLPAAAGRAADWAVRWSRSAPARLPSLRAFRP